MSKLLPEEVLRLHWGHSAFRGEQQRVVASVLEGRDTLALMPTGGGKSVCYQVPALMKGGTCLVISPLIALMEDQVEGARARGLTAIAITSAMRHDQVDSALESCALGKYQFLYISPERIASEMFRARLHRLPITLIAVDEAHCISQWGFDFRPSYMRIPEIRAVLPEVPIVALTATATAQVVADIVQRLELRDPAILKGDLHREEITFWVSTGADKQGRLERIARTLPGSGIVYLRDRKGTVRVAGMLRNAGVSAAAYHAGLSHAERSEVQQRWSTGELRYVVATNAFGMGIDKSDVRCVVHWDAPSDPESYYQEAGRAGRDGEAAYAILLNSPGDVERLRDRVLSAFPEPAEVRAVYQAIADKHRIALGSGMEETYSLDLDELAAHAHLSRSTVVHALKTLELNGDLVLSEGARSPSRVVMTAPHRVVLDMRTRGHRTAPLLEALLRLHGGLFEAPVAIDEGRLARQAGTSTAASIGMFRELEQLGVLTYSARANAPQCTLLTHRRDAATLVVDKEALQLRKERALERLEAMTGYVSANSGCRARILLTYFGADRKAPCGKCDLCRAHGGASDQAMAKASTAFDPERMRWELDIDEQADART